MSLTHRLWDHPGKDAWLNLFELFAEGKGLLMTDAARAAPRQRLWTLLLHHPGTDVQHIFFTLSNIGEKTDYDAAVTALNAYSKPRVNKACVHHQFRLLTPKQGKTTGQFMTRLQHHITHCDYRTDSDNQIRDEVFEH